MNPAIRTEHLTVRYGRHIAVDEVEPGAAYAFRSDEVSRTSAPHRRKA